MPVLHLPLGCTSGTATMSTHSPPEPALLAEEPDQSELLTARLARFLASPTGDRQDEQLAHPESSLESGSTPNTELAPQEEAFSATSLAAATRWHEARDAGDELCGPWMCAMRICRM